MLSQRHGSVNGLQGIVLQVGEHEKQLIFRGEQRIVFVDGVTIPAVSGQSMETAGLSMLRIPYRMWMGKTKLMPGDRYGPGP